MCYQLTFTFRKRILFLGQPIVPHSRTIVHEFIFLLHGLSLTINLSSLPLSDVTLFEFMFATPLSFLPQVNILVHTTDVPVSQKEIYRLKTLLEEYKDRDHNKSSNKVVDQPLTNTTKATLALNGECIKDVTGKSSIRGENTEDLVFQDRPVIDLNFPDSNAEASTHSGFSSRADAGTIRSNNMSKANDQDHELDSETTIYCSGTIHRVEDLEHEKLRRHDTQSSSCRKEKQAADSFGAQWDIFRRQDVPNLLEYLRRHCNDSIPAYHSPVHVRRCKQISVLL